MNPMFSSTVEIELENKKMQHLSVGLLPYEQPPQYTKNELFC